MDRHPARALVTPSVTTRLADIWRRATGPSALTLPVWAIAFAPSLTTVMLHDRNKYGGSLALWMLAGIAGALCAGGVLAIAHFLSRGRLRGLSVLIVFTAAGVARGLGVAVVVAVLDLAPTPQWASRAGSGAVLAVCWLAIATLIVDGYRRHRAAVNEIAQQGAQAQAARDFAEVQLGEIRGLVETRLITTLDSGVATLDRVMASPPDPRAADAVRGTAEEIGGTVSSVVRPLSHDLATPIEVPVAVVRLPRIPLRIVLADVVTVTPFNPGWVGSLLFLSILFTALSVYGPGLGLLGAFLIAACAAVVLLILQRLITPRLVRLPSAACACIVVLGWLLAAAASTIPILVTHRMGIGPDYAVSVYALPLLAYVPVTAFGTAIVLVIDRQFTLSEAQMQSVVDDLAWVTRRMEQQILADRRRLARVLHGSVQSALTASAMRLEQVAQRLALGEASVDLPAEIATLRALRDRLAVVASEAPEPIDAATVLDDIAMVWRNVASIQMAFDTGMVARLDHDPLAAEQVVEVVREAISNAVRHGRATRISVTACPAAPSDIEIVIDDDGVFSDAQGRGMGTEIMQSLTRWLRWEPSPLGGTRVTCLIASDQH